MIIKNLDNSIVLNSSFPLSSSNPIIYLTKIPSLNKQIVGSVRMPNFWIKNGAFSESSDVNEVSGCSRAIILKCLSTILHLSKSL